MENRTFSKKNPRLNYFGNIFLVVVVVAVLSLFMKRSNTISLQVVDNGMTITMASGYTETVSWDTLNSVEERETLDLGTLVEGTDTKKEQSGVWENTEFGAYSLCSDATVHCYLVLHTEDGIVVLNYESDESTRSLGEAIVDVLESE